MITVLIALFLVATAPIAPQQQVTFSETIAPIVYEHCVTCHRPGEAGPFPLISYEDVKKRGATIAAVTRSRYMPPWHATRGYGMFRDERGLTDAEIGAIEQWVNHGMAQGDPAKMPQLPVFTEGWHLGKPDLILEMPAAYDLPASGPDIFRDFVVPSNLSEDKWVRAIEFRPGARKVVHHVLFAYDTSGAARKLDGADGRPGFEGNMAGTFGPAGNVVGLGGWAVGSTPAFLPEGYALRLPKGSDILLQIHFHLTGKVESERSTLGIYFADKAPEKTLFGVDMPSLFGFGAGISIPAGKSDYTIEDSVTLPADVQAFGVAAHAHYVAKEMKATATLPDGMTQPLIWIQDWDFNWQDTYSFKAPVILPKGTRIDVRLTYDNSAENPRNPNSPPKPILWGELSSDEMGTVVILLGADRREDEPLLQQLLAARQRTAIQRGVQDGTLKRMMDRRSK